MTTTVRRLQTTLFRGTWFSLAVYLGLALGTTWPLVLSPRTALPLGSLPQATVPLFNLWTIWWNSDRALQQFSGYWNAPIFHPQPDSFAFSEPQPTSLLVAPVIWLTGSRAMGYNVYLWLSLVLTGIVTERLLRICGVRRLAAVAGGATMILLPLVHWQRDVIQLVPLAGALWSWTALRQLGSQPTLRRGIELGAAVGVSFLACCHQGAFLVLLLASTGGVLVRRWFRLRLWVSIAAAGVVAAVLIVPVAVPLKRAADHHQFARSAETVARLSALPGDYTAAVGRPLVATGLLAARPNWKLSPGWIRVALASLAVVCGLARRRSRRWTLFLGTTAGLAFLLSLGPNLVINGWRPWWTLTAWVPGLSQVRNVFRFAFFVQMAVVLLAAQALHCMGTLSRARIRSTAGRWCVRILIVVATGLMLLDVRPDPMLLAEVPDAAAHAGWIDFVRRETPAGKAVACLPFAAGNRLADYETTTRWMYFGTFHGVPLINGYSGFFPGDHFRLRDSINREFPTADLLQRLADSGAELIVVERSGYPAETMRPASGPDTDSALRLELVLEDPAGVDVYRLRF